jgi:hypothetical protein
MRLRVDSRYNPVSGLADFWNEFRRPAPYRWPLLLLSAAITATLVYAFARERVYAPPERPEVTYITSFEPGRSEAEIAASNEENQVTQEALRALQEEREELRRELYRELGRATGIDVDAIQAQIDAEEEAEAAAGADATTQTPATAPLD